MSEQEQHLIAGRTLVEYGEAKRKLAALNAKAADVAKTMRTLAAALHKEPNSHWSLTVGGREWIEAFEKFPTRDALAELADEIQTTANRKRELFVTMRDMGYEPKDSE